MAEQPQAKGAPTTELGTSGFSAFGGIVSQEFLPELRGLRGRRVYQEMADNDPIIGGMLFAIEMAYRKTEPVVEPGGETPADVEAAEFLTSCIADLSHTWADFMSDVVTQFRYGWAWFETVYKRREGPEGETPSLFDDGRVGWRKFAYRDQNTLERWDFDPKGGLQGMIQRPPAGAPGASGGLASITIPIGRSLHFKTAHAGGNPEGRSILRSAYTAWYYRKNLQAIEGISLERLGAGIPVMKLPAGATDADFAEAKAVIRRFKVDEQMGFTLPAGWDLDIAFGTGRNVGEAFEAPITRYRAEIMVSVLAQFILLGLDKVGSYALSQTHRDIFQVALEGWLRGIEAVINRFAVPRLFAFNAFPGITALPQISLGKIGDRNVDLMITALKELVPAGVLTVDEALEAAVREAVGLPELTKPAEGRPAPDTGSESFAAYDAR